MARSRCKACDVKNVLLEGKGEVTMSSILSSHCSHFITCLAKLPSNEHREFDVALQTLCDFRFGYNDWTKRWASPAAVER